MKRFLFTVSFLILCYFAFPFENYPAGARFLLLSHAAFALSDVWEIFHNKVGMSLISQFSAGFYYVSKFQVGELSLVAVSLILPSNSL